MCFKQWGAYVYTMYRLVIFLACVWVDLSVWVRRLHIRLLDTMRVYMYVLYRRYANYCMSRQYSLFIPYISDRIDDTPTRYSIVNRATRVPDAFSFGVLFYGRSLPLVSYFMTRVGEPPSVAEYTILGESSSNTTLDLVRGRNVTANRDFMFGEIDFDTPISST